MRELSWLGLLLVACSRHPVPPSAETGPETGTPPAPEPSAPAVPAEPLATPSPPPSTGEARRSTLPSLDREPLLRAASAQLREHFGASQAGRFALQRVELAGGRAAFLATRADESDPMVLVVDRGEVAWSKLRPVAGITPPVLHLAIAPRPDGGVALFSYVAGLHIVAARMWADDGNPYAEIQIMSPEACDALSGAYAPGQGWIVACASDGGTKAQRLREDGTTAWGSDGVPVGAPSPVGPATLVIDSPSTWILVQRVKAVGGDHVLAFRYDARARPLWPSEVDTGALPRGPGAGGRVVATAAGAGTVRVELPGGKVRTLSR